MKILHTADWHIGEFPGPEFQGINRRLMDTSECLSHMHSVALEEKPDLVLVCGDVFHTAQVWVNRGIDETMRAIHAIESLTEVCPVVVLRGTPNHDGDKQFEMLKTYFTPEAYSDHVYIVTEPQVLRIDTLVYGSVQVAALPGFDRGVFRAKFPAVSREEENLIFTDELGKIVLGLRADCDSSIPSVLITHYTVPGCNMESGQTQLFAGAEPIITPEILDAAAFDLVALGHIHRPQQLESCKNTFYCGAINALNFNDEGQERGFYLHTLYKPEYGACDLDSRFVATPYRGFLTVRLDDVQIAMMNSGNTDEIEMLAGLFWRDEIKDKIVRVIYTCTEENNKAFVPATLEKMLYEDGAFWVAEILPEKVYPAVSHKGLSEKTDPETNLIQYLCEKGVDSENMVPIIEAARPIIAKALSSETTSRYTGVFEPVSVEVKNYRNYVDESFDFTGISFCTINGKNGAGKSSLFMDAILDCLYEEPREGDLVGWIRSDKAARSGAITFTFRIGSKTFRVSRTRAKSGKATLNIAELVDGEWINRSKERLRDTQDEIISILGMDSLTFRSCALIMQDQYGLFLEADKESRISILGSILGLGVYSDMEMYARDKAANVNREINQRNILIKNKLEQIKPEDDLKVRLVEANGDIHRHTLATGHTQKQRDLAYQTLTAKELALNEAKIIQEAVTRLASQRDDMRANLLEQAKVMAAADAFLSTEAVIITGVDEYYRLVEQEKELIAGVTECNGWGRELASVRDDISRTRAKLLEIEGQQADIQRQICTLNEQLSKEEDLRDAEQEYEVQKANLTALEGRGDTYHTLTTSIANLQRLRTEHKTAFSAEASTRSARIKELKAKISLLENSNCPYPDEATCSFLADARKAKEEHDPYVAACTEWKQTEQAKSQEMDTGIENMERQRDSLGYDPVVVKQLREVVAALERHARDYESLAAVRQQVGIHSQNLQSLNISHAAEKAHLDTLEEKETALNNQLSDNAGIVLAHEQVKTDLAAAAKWLDDEKRIPVEREKRINAAQRVEDLERQIDALEQDISAKTLEIQQKDSEALDIQSYRDSVTHADQTLAEYRKKLDALQVETGAILQQLKSIEEVRASIAEMQGEINDLADRAASYGVIKSAFSQDGIPHNIICSIVPNLTATANKILGQMTGGRMGMEFRTEKMLKNGKKEVVTLDIFIEEYGNGILPYRSKSGGEKVKAALSAILSLAEIKSTSAGIQLGMLFIDEPPFLDGDGIQAYCDALETIRSRYTGLKVMAITHDPMMKARFPQSIDVLKGENGSYIKIL